MTLRTIKQRSFLIAHKKFPHTHTARRDGRNNDDFGPVWFRSSRVRDGRSRIIPPNGSRRSPSQTRRSRSISSPQRRLEKRPKRCDLENASRVPERSPGSPPLLAPPHASKSAGRRSSSSPGAPPPRLELLPLSSAHSSAGGSTDGSARPQLRRPPELLPLAGSSSPSRSPHRSFSPTKDLDVNRNFYFLSSGKAIDSQE